MPYFVGPASLIQSDFRSSNHGNFEAVLWHDGRIEHHFGVGRGSGVEWTTAQTLPTAARGPASIIQSNFHSSDHGNFEVVFEDSGLVHWFHDNSDVNLPWRRAETVTNPSMYVFFTADHIHDPDGLGDSMGRSVLGRSEDGGLNFGPPLYTLSTDKFINVSLQQVDNARYPGLPARAGQSLIIWGSGGYRRSNVYLAHIPLAEIEDRSTLRYFSGVDVASGTPQWGDDEARAVPLFLSGSVGELSVRWNQFLNTFVLMYNSDNPPSVLERQSATPWGPWTSHENIWDWNDAAGRSVHVAGSNDGLSDPGQESEGGGPYGPYPIAPYTKQIGDGRTLMYFVLSVHNPYNTMLLAALIRARH